MNKRIKKKKQKLEAMHASKYKYAKLGIKRAHAVYIQTRHCFWGLIPHKDNYAMYLLRKRRCGKREHDITQHILSSKMLYMQENDRKEVKEKMYLKGDCCDESSYKEETTEVIKNARF